MFRQPRQPLQLLGQFTDHGDHEHGHSGCRESGDMRHGSAILPGDRFKFPAFLPQPSVSPMDTGCTAGGRRCQRQVASTVTLRVPFRGRTSGRLSTGLPQKDSFGPREKIVRFSQGLRPREQMAFPVARLRPCYWSKPAHPLVTPSPLAMDSEPLTTRQAAQRLGIARASLYSWLAQSNAGTFVLHGRPVTIDCLQSGANGQGRIRIEAREVERLKELMRVQPHLAPRRRPSTNRHHYPGIHTPLGRPGD
jgi:hypothetical protein